MKTATNTNRKHNVGALAIIGCIFAIAGFASSQHLSPKTIYKMDVIEVTASRMKVERMATIVVTASQNENTIVAANSKVNAAF